jgi:hypothetical protein
MSSTPVLFVVCKLDEAAAIAFEYSVGGLITKTPDSGQQVRFRAAVRASRFRLVAPLIGTVGHFFPGHRLNVASAVHGEPLGGKNVPNPTYACDDVSLTRLNTDRRRTNRLCFVLAH